MPELPEVETIRRGLSGFLLGKTISRVAIHDRRALEGFLPSGGPRRRAPASEFQSALVGQSIRDVLRRGKYLIFSLSGGAAFLCHLRMTGQLIWGPRADKPRVQIQFENEPNALFFCDTRRFGEMWVAARWQEDPSIQALGPEPFGDGWDVASWGASLKKSGAKIQAALLDQKRLAGLGNIYVTEALFLSGVRPTRRCDKLKASEIPGLAKNIKSVLNVGLTHRGVSFYSYRDAAGERGDALDRLKVYGRGGQPCLHCKTPLKDVKVSGRGTVYCPRCQS